VFTVDLRREAETGWSISSEGERGKEEGRVISSTPCLRAQGESRNERSRRVEKKSLTRLFQNTSRQWQQERRAGRRKKDKKVSRAATKKKKDADNDFSAALSR